MFLTLASFSSLLVQNPDLEAFTSIVGLPDKAPEEETDQAAQGRVRNQFECPSPNRKTKHLPCQKKVDKNWPPGQTKEAMWRPMVVKRHVKNQERLLWPNHRRDKQRTKWSGL
jgi:hypothetical protein